MPHETKMPKSCLSLISEQICIQEPAVLVIQRIVHKNQAQTKKEDPDDTEDTDMVFPLAHRPGHKKSSIRVGQEKAYFYNHGTKNYPWKQPGRKSHTGFGQIYPSKLLTSTQNAISLQIDVFFPGFASLPANHLLCPDRVNSDTPGYN